MSFSPSSLTMRKSQTALVWSGPDDGGYNRLFTINSNGVFKFEHLPTGGTPPADCNHYDFKVTALTPGAGSVIARYVDNTGAVKKTDYLWIYVKSPQAPTINAINNPDGSVEVTIQTNEAGGATYYTTDGSQPGVNTNLWEGVPIVFDQIGSYTVKAVTYFDLDYSATVTRSITIGPPQKPNIEWPSGSYTDKLLTSIYAQYGDVYYTVDGSDPQTSETAILYTGPVLIEETCKLRAKNFKLGQWGEEDFKDYTIMPLWNPYTKEGMDGMRLCIDQKLLAAGKPIWSWARDINAFETPILKTDIIELRQALEAVVGVQSWTEVGLMSQGNNAKDEVWYDLRTKVRKMMGWIS